MTNKKLPGKKPKQEGFTLVELAIVIVIIGFIVAGISAGASLVKQAQLRSVITDFNNFQVAYNNFLGRYSSVAGDFNRAYSYWPSTVTTASNYCADTAADCNGDGNGLIDWSTGGGTTSEGRKAWRHLAIAGMITGGITGISSADVSTIIVGIQTPISKVSGAGYLMAGYDSGGNAFNGMASPWSGTNKNSVYIGKNNPSTGDAHTGLSNGAFSPDDAFTLDQKIDDGTVDASNNFNGAQTGVIRVINSPNISSNGCNTANVYNASNTAAVAQTSCVLGFQLN